MFTCCRALPSCLTWPYLVLFKICRRLWTDWFMPLSSCYPSLFPPHRTIPASSPTLNLTLTLTLNTPLSLSVPAGFSTAKQQCTQTLPNAHLQRCTCAGVTCQRPTNASRNRLSYCVLTVCRDDRQAEEKHSPHAQMGSADHPTAGGACRG